MTALALYAFFGLCAIIGVAPHVHYRKPGTVVVPPGQTLIMTEEGDILGMMPTEPDAGLPPYPSESKRP